MRREVRIGLGECYPDGCAVQFCSVQRAAVLQYLTATLTSTCTMMAEQLRQHWVVSLCRGGAGGRW